MRREPATPAPAGPVPPHRGRRVSQPVEPSGPTDSDSDADTDTDTGQTQPEDGGKDAASPSQTRTRRRAAGPPPTEPAAPEPSAPEPSAPEPSAPTAPVPPPADAPGPELIELAQAHGVATEYWDWQGRHTVVPPSTIKSVLAALDVDASSPPAVTRSLVAARERPWRQVLPDVLVVRQGSHSRVLAHVDHDVSVELWLQLEDGSSQVPLAPADHDVDPKVIDGRLVTELAFVVPGDLPPGWHQMLARLPGGEVDRPLVVTPKRLELPEALRSGRAWGFTADLFAIRSQYSWGVGDLADLAELAAWSARDHGADVLMVNPLHAAEVIPPMEPSPYLPTTRRFRNPLYLRVEEIREVAYMPSTDRALIEWQAEAIRGMNLDPGGIDRDAVWEAKRSALETVFAQPRSRSRQAAFEAYCEREGEGLLDYASWCALTERYGLPMTSWPAHALDARSTSVAQLREELADRVQFYMWLQWCLDEQAAEAQRQALEAGMAIGIVHELAIGVHPDGVDVWALADVLAADVSVGAPADADHHGGQDFAMPPWRPDRLEEQGYTPYRDMLRTVLRHSGGLRVDHIIGLFRSWWVPHEAAPAAGTYVRYDHEAMIGILVLEAQRAGAFVIGEDIGGVEPWARDYLRERGLLGTSVLWWERDHEGQPLRPQAWRELCLATVTAGDLPPTAGYLAGEHVELRDRLGLLARPLAEEMALDEASRAAVLGQLRELGLLGEQSSERERVEALHRFLTWTPAKLIGVALADAVGDRRSLHQPATFGDYPSWRLPLADGVGRPVLLEDVMASVRAASLARTVNGR